MKPFDLKIYSADEIFYEGPCESLIVPTPEGYLGFQANHEPMISAVSEGKITYRIPGEENKIGTCSRGMVRADHNEVMVLVDVIERPEDIDINRAKREAEISREAMLQEKGIQEYKAAEARLRRALNRLKVKEEFEQQMKK